MITAVLTDGDVLLILLLSLLDFRFSFSYVVTRLYSGFSFDLLVVIHLVVGVVWRAVVTSMKSFGGK